MAYSYARFGHKLLKILSESLYSLNSVIYKIHLAAPAQFTQYGVPDHKPAVFGDVGLNGISLFGGAVQHAHIPYSHQGHMQCARNGSSRQGEHVYAAFKLLYALLMRNAEALLFIHNQQPQILKGHILCQKRMRTRNYIYAALPEAG